MTLPTACISGFPVYVLPKKDRIIFFVWGPRAGIIYIYIYPPACFSTRACFKLFFFQTFYFREFFPETSFQNNYNSTEYREKNSLINFYHQRITSFKGPHASSHHSPLGPSPLFSTPKNNKKKQGQQKLFFWDLCVPGPPKWLQKLTNACLCASIFMFFSFSAEVWFWTTLPWFICFYGFRVSLFLCRRCPKSNKTHSCCRGGSGAHF